MKRRTLAVGAAIVASGALLAALAINDGEERVGVASDADRQGFARLKTEDAPPEERERRSPWRSLSISPRVGDPGTVFRLTAPTPSPNRGAPANYPAFELAGPGGRKCRGRLRTRFGLGFDGDDDATRSGSQVRFVPPQRQDPLAPPDTSSNDRGLDRRPWCPGRYRMAAIELRFKDAGRQRVLARRVFRVRPRRRGAPTHALRAFHGVTRARIGKDIIGTPYRLLLARLGEPKAVPSDYYRSNGQRCLYYDVVFRAADRRDSHLASTWQFCLRRGRVHSATGSLAIPLRGR